MTDAADTSKDTEDQNKPSLKDIAAKDEAQAAKDGAKGAAKKDAAAKPGDAKSGQDKPSGAVPKKGGGGFVWFLLVLIVIGGGVAAGWPYIGPKVEPAVADLRQLMGLGPRPTQATLPSESGAQTMAEAPTAGTQEPPADEPAQTMPEETTPAESPATGTGDGGAQDAQEGGAEAQPAPAQEPITQPLDQTAGSAGLDALATDIEVLKSRVDALASMAGSVSGEDAQAALDATAELTRTIAALQSDIQALRDRVQELEDGARADPTAPAQALVLASTQVRTRLMGDEPFAAELSALDHIAGSDPTVQAAVQRLRPHAEVGVPTEAALTARFPKVAKAIITARTTGDAGGWLGRVKDGLGGLVTVRRTDPQAITDAVERAVAVAEAALELGDLAEAVQALSALEGGAGDAAAAWLGEARARVEAEAALEDLHAHALAVLSAAGGQ